MSLISRSRRGTVGAAAAIIVVATLAGCSTRSADTSPSSPADVPAPSQTVTGVAGARAEYDAATKKYALPEGFTYPPAPYSDSSGNYEAGYGESDAVRFWNCAWGKTYIKLRTVDPAAADNALTQYAALENTPTWSKALDPESIQKPFLASIESAKLGDPSAIANEMQINCP
ncbi:MAG: hypothetical protein JWN36_810 [Microbacteriaceae bacterium]|nr:hypothetical protein [Microbacteriaceae bacterium]